ncbi:MAG: Asp-tRNA(Asn)/Glu-tRNA(Gln) amidotransferase subunit GatB [Firmicutes bacterium]|nr:Asp-tRNA(Asn)/Glu-tRNA(Gln) amidotransferase subunit GatB [Alicyclobacillaceae bacterium]MCL6497899.1 Asp-tRNA(Asn)/Glu-tRNA(Gln) amidotransferase subunit GatB [Bacillota bacterium]
MTAGPRYEVIIGLEVHVELKTRTKLFCGCENRFGAPPNTLTCPVCLGLPGVLPVLNREAVAMAARAGLALGCTVREHSRFDRKQYFYPDLPKGYQISQYDHPLCEHGQLRLYDGQGQYRKTVRIRRIHLEEDAGKLNHLGERLSDATGSLVDLNRAGVPLIEIVSEPDLRSGEEARWYLNALRATLAYLDVSDLRMEEGSMRCDANISLRPLDFTGSLADLPRVEVKNLNSVRNVERAIEYEVRRQAAQLSQGLGIERETRGFDDASGRTYSQRSKEEAHDYRYFPEPDLPPLVLTTEQITAWRDSLPSLPDAVREDLTAAGIDPRTVEVVVQDPAAVAYLWAAAQDYGRAEAVANWMLADLARLLNAHRRSYRDCPVPPAELANLLRLIDRGTLSGRMAKEVLEVMFVKGVTAEAAVAQLGVSQISDVDHLRPVVEAVIAEQPKVVADWRAGKEKAIGFLVGQVMKRTAGQANPELVNRLLREVLARQAHPLP